MADKKHEEFKHIALNQNDRGLLACPKTLLHRNNNKMYAKLRLAVDSVNFMNMGLMNEDQISSSIEGGAVMYHLMTNPELLKDCKNIYEQHESEKTDCVVCGSSYPNLKQDSDTCYECRKKHE